MIVKPTKKIRIKSIKKVTCPICGSKIDVFGKEKNNLTSFFFKHPTHLGENLNLTYVHFSFVCNACSCATSGSYMTKENKESLRKWKNEINLYVK